MVIASLGIDANYACIREDFEGFAHSRPCAHIAIAGLSPSGPKLLGWNPRLALTVRNGAATRLPVIALVKKSHGLGIAILLEQHLHSRFIPIGFWRNWATSPFESERMAKTRRQPGLILYSAAASLLYVAVYIV